MNFGQAIRKYRQAKKLSQPALSSLVNITPTYLSAIENNRKEPSLKLIDEICNALHIPKEVVFWEAINITDQMNKNDKEIISTAKEIINSYFQHYQQQS